MADVPFVATVPGALGAEPAASRPPRRPTPLGRRVAAAVGAPRGGALAVALQQLIARRDFEVHFQPIVDGRGAGGLLGYEALVRPPRTSPLASPPVLFQVAAEAGRLVALERVIVRQAVRRFVELQLPGRVFLNVTADTLIAARHRQPLIQRELARHGLPAGRIVVELVETRAVTDEAALASVVASLRAAGLCFALDDLGEGFASLKRWIDLRPDFVKIDRHFVDGLHADPLRQQFVRSILEMAHSSGAEVIAEGLEHAADWQALRALGARFIQGYLVARPAARPWTRLPPAFAGEGADRPPRD